MKIRTKQPQNNKYYIRTVTGGLNGAVAGDPTISGANVLCNCVGYANGRFNEIWNDPNLEGIVKPFHVQLVCNAENFIESAKRQGLKISQTPIEGGIMVWQKGTTLNGGDGAGHVAVVERVYDDGTILTSESGWASWAFKTIRRDNENGRWKQNSYYKFRGCIINPSVKNPKVVPAPPLEVDGIGGTCTVRAMQRFFGTTQDGVLSGQNKAQSKYYPSLKAVEYGTGGSACVKKLQKWVGTTQDGVIGEKTVKAWQKKIGVASDGIFGANSMREWQEYLNTHKKAIYPSTGRKSYKVIDVSDWQGKINWKKVKADGVVGAIIRYADGNTLDKRFAENMKNAKAVGVHIGSYIFSRAKTKAEAEKEAERLYNACKPYAPDMPLYIDLEVPTLSKYANMVAQVFLNKMKSLGGEGGVYANLNWWDNYLADTAKDYSTSPFWIAQYNSTMDYKPASAMGMWQYTSSGSVDGISGKVDMDRCYVAYWDKTIGSLANKYSYPTNTEDADYDGGSPTPAYKNGLKEAYPDRSSWGTAPRKGASCDVFVGTCVRNSGVDGKFPRGLDEQIPHLANSSKFKEVKVTVDTVKDGDIIVYAKEGGGAHICIAYGGKIKEAGNAHYYPKTTNYLKDRLSKDGKKWLKVYRAR